MEIRISRQRGIPVYLQIIEQVRFQIDAGVWQKGQQLPPAQALAQQLSVHINTVNRAYNQLASAGYIVSRQGSGTFVSGPRERVGTRKDQKQLWALLEGACREALELGFSPEEFAAMGNLVAQTLTSAASKRVALVECHESWLREIASVVSDELEVEVVPFVLDDLRTDATLRDRFRDLQVVLTNISHAEAVAEIVGPAQRVYTFVLYPSVEVINRLASLSAKRVGILFMEEDVAARLESAFRSVGLQVRLETLGETPDDDLAERIAEFDAVLVATTDLPRLSTDLSPKVVELRTSLAHESLDMLKRDLAGWLAQAEDLQATSVVARA